MSLIVEDGTGLAGAESYISVANADTYHANRGNTLWATMTVTEREQALRRSADYFLQAYRGGWKGNRLTTTQALDWPRAWVQLDDVAYANYAYFIPNNTVPVTVANAQAEMAFAAASGELNPSQSRGILKEIIGPLTTEYDPYSPENIRYPKVDTMLKPYLTNGGGACFKLMRS